MHIWERSYTPTPTNPNLVLNTYLKLDIVIHELYVHVIVSSETQ